MEKFYKIQISKQKIGHRDRLIYPDGLGQDFVSLGYKSDCSEAVVKTDIPKQKQNAIKTDQRITPLTKKEAEDLVKAYGASASEGALDTAADPRSAARVSMLKALGAVPTDDFLENQAVITQEDWKTPKKLLNNWANYGDKYNPVGFYKDILGIVHLRGLIKEGKIGARLGVIFQLPSEYRPQHRQLHIVATHPNAVGRVDITADGMVIAVSGDSHWISLDGIHFRAAQ